MCKVWDLGVVSDHLTSYSVVICVLCVSCVAFVMDTMFCLLFVVSHDTACSGVFVTELCFTMSVCCDVCFHFPQILAEREASQEDPQSLPALRSDSLHVAKHPV